MTNGVVVPQAVAPVMDTTPMVHGIICAVAHNATCFIAKDAASKWSKPSKVIRIAEQAIEAIQILGMQAQGSQPNPFVSMAQQAGVVPVPADRSGVVTETVAAPKDDPRLVRLETKVHALQTGMETLLERIPAL